MKIKIIETTSPMKTYTIEKVKREIGVHGEEPAGEYHRHTLEESDRIKRNSVQRQALKLEKEIKKVQVSYLRAANLVHMVSYHYLSYIYSSHA